MKTVEFKLYNNKKKITGFFGHFQANSKQGSFSSNEAAFI